MRSVEDIQDMIRIAAKLLNLDEVPRLRIRSDLPFFAIGMFSVENTGEMVLSINTLAFDPGLLAAMGWTNFSIEEIVAHEMIHCAQYLNGDLRFAQSCIAPRRIIPIWKNEEVLTRYSAVDKHSPWEAEAYGGMYELAANMINSKTKQAA